MLKNWSSGPEIISTELSHWQIDLVVQKSSAWSCHIKRLIWWSRNLELKAVTLTDWSDSPKYFSTKQSHWKIDLVVQKSSVRSGHVVELIWWSRNFHHEAVTSTDRSGRPQIFSTKQSRWQIDLMVQKSLASSYHVEGVIWWSRNLWKTMHSAVLGHCGLLNYCTLCPWLRVQWGPSDFKFGVNRLKYFFSRHSNWSKPLGCSRKAQVWI